MSSTTSSAPDGVAAPAAPRVSADDALRAGKPPVGTGASPLFAQLIALVFIAAGVVLVQHLLVALGAVGGTSWLTTVVDAFDAIAGDSALVLVVGVVAVVLGVLLLPVVIKPRPHKGLALTANTGVYLRPRDVARIVDSALDGTDTVTSLDVRARRRKVRVVATSVAAKDRNDEIVATLRAGLDGTLSAFERRPKSTVKIRNVGV